MSREMTKEQMATLKDDFNAYDKNGDGFITKEEFASVMKAAGMELSDAELNKIIDDLDVDGNRKIDFKEFLGQMTEPQS
ncbi:hypothetical protein FRC15_004477 [Serendipita sp. 397]|nr:hypothetical protein FRC15_004477 [Serendipita sp. 397]